MEVEVPKIQFSRLNKCIVMVQRILRWERQERWFGRKKQGPMVEKCCYNDFLWNFFGALYIQLFPLGKAHMTHFSVSIWCNEFWEASPPSMCLDHIIAHDAYLSFHTLPFKLAPTCSIKQCGTSRTQEFECRFVFLVYQLNFLEFGGL